MGSRGPRGLTGASGDTGVTGPPGPLGTPGFTGATGQIPQYLVLKLVNSIWRISYIATSHTLNFCYGGVRLVSVRPSVCPVLRILKLTHQGAAPTWPAHVPVRTYEGW